MSNYYLSIKEFSQLSGVEISTLRYWDEIGLFAPAKRDPSNHYRYYTPDQMISLNFINVLSSLDISLKTISKIEQSLTPEKIIRLIELQEQEIDKELRRLRECYSVLHTRRELINLGSRVAKGFKTKDGVCMDDDDEPENGIMVDETKIAVLQRKERSYVLGPRNEWVEGEDFYKPFMNFCKCAGDMRINLGYPIGSVLDSWKDFLEAPGKPQYFFSSDPSGNRKRAAGKYLTGFHRGYYGEFGDLPERMDAFAKENSLALTGPVFTLYMHDEICIKDPGRYLVQVYVSVKKSKRK